MKYNNGRDYEKFVANLQQALLDAEQITNQTNIIIELNKKIIDNCGIEREFDLYWEYSFGGLIYKTIIECKDYNSNISIDKIDALIGKISDIPDLRAVFATKKGYQSGAKTKAEKNKIDLLIIREQNDSDWQDKDGNSLLKIINIAIHMNMPAQITKFEPHINGDWINENTDIDISKPLTMSGLNNEIFIEDIDRNKKYSLFDLSNKLTTLGSEEFGIFSKNEKFDNAFIYYKDIKFKIDSYFCEYSISKSHKSSIEIDFSKELVGVIEYLQLGTKKSIFKEGIIKEQLL
ncbi:MAG: restriction endonuclease [Arcobacter sp.]|nr:MAG: restriction endonuclease [Arcobacter sp.]